jgi:hypothetical protein
MPHRLPTGFEVVDAHMRIDLVLTTGGDDLDAVPPDRVADRLARGPVLPMALVDRVMAAICASKLDIGLPCLRLWAAISA